jgi:hypothetical protein
MEQMMMPTSPITFTPAATPSCSAIFNLTAACTAPPPLPPYTSNINNSNGGSNVLTVPGGCPKFQGESELLSLLQLPRSAHSNSSPGAPHGQHHLMNSTLDGATAFVGKVITITTYTTYISIYMFIFSHQPASRCRILKM